jgi:hypothetical protein
VVMVVIVWVIEKLICDGREEARVLVRWTREVIASMWICGNGEKRVGWSGFVVEWLWVVIGIGRGAAVM